MEAMEAMVTVEVEEVEPMVILLEMEALMEEMGSILHSLVKVSKISMNF